MNHERRDESETPRMETRTFTADDGRKWAGSVMSGRFRGGEEHAEVIFVCEDTPSEDKRFVRMDGSAVEVSEQWRGMGEVEMRTLFQESEPA